MCFYCKAHNSRYMQYKELLIDKAYKYKIRTYNYYCMWYIDFDCDREGDKFTYFYLNRNGKVYIFKWHSNGKYHRNYDKPTCINFNSIFKNVYMDKINYLAWRQNGIRHREENKPSAIQLHFNGNIRKLEWYCNGVSLHINKLHKLYLNENGDID